MCTAYIFFQGICCNRCNATYKCIVNISLSMCHLSISNEITKIPIFILLQAYPTRSQRFLYSYCCKHIQRDHKDSYFILHLSISNEITKIPIFILLQAIQRDHKDSYIHIAFKHIQRDHKDSYIHCKYCCMSGMLCKLACHVFFLFFLHHLPCSAP